MEKQYTGSNTIDANMIYGYGALSKIAQIKAKFKPKKILLVTGKNSYEVSGAKAIIEVAFSNDEYIRFSDFSVNPKLEDGKKGTRLALDANIDLILAIGGGSVLDMAKLIKASLFTPDKAEALVRGKIPVTDVNIPLIGVPTTAGSGSEATHFAIVYIGKDKFSLTGASLLPNMVILDGKLINSASPYQKAIDGLDALAQAIEGCWAVNSTQEGRDYSFEAIELLVKHLPGVVAGGNEGNGSNEKNLQSVMKASNLAGKSINIAKSTAPHAFSYAFTSYHNIAHGHAVWLTLPRIFAIHMSAEAKICDPRGAEYFNNIMARLCDALGMKNDEDHVAYLQDFMEKLHIEPDMTRLGITNAEQRKFVASKVNLERFANNPVVIEEAEISQIFDI